MKNRAILLATGVISTVIIFNANTIKYKTTGGHPSSTGAPGEKTCAQSGCHDDAQTKDGTGVNTLTFGNNETKYSPGLTYDMKVNITKAGINKFGFEIVALKDKDNSNVGSWTITDATRMQIINGESPNTSRKYITHKTNGTTPVTAGVGEWTFKWKAPATDAGNITFYYSTNAANKNNQNTGDEIYLSKFTVTSDATSVVEAEAISGMSAYVINNELSLSFQSKEPGKSKLLLFNIQGEMLSSKEMEHMKGRNNAVLDVSKISSGVYVMYVQTVNGVSSKKIYIEK